MYASVQEKFKHGIILNIQIQEIICNDDNMYDEIICLRANPKGQAGHRGEIKTTTKNKVGRIIPDSSKDIGKLFLDIPKKSKFKISKKSKLKNVSWF